MFEIRVEADFAAAHFLQDYNGKCENMHGHNYKVYAHIRGSALNESGILFDFAALKRALKNICKALDHTNLNNMETFAQNPTAERIALYIYDHIIDCMDNAGCDVSYSHGKKTPYLYAVDVFETDRNRARYSIDDKTMSNP